MRAAAVSSDVGNRLYSNGFDAMRSLGASPRRYFLTNILWAFLIASPFLVGLGFLAARVTSLAVFTYNYAKWGPNYWDDHFHRDLRIPGEVLYRGTAWLLAKVLTCGVGIGAIAYHIGARPKRSCILLWMNGGPSQTDTFDMKPGHEHGGPFQAIQSRVPDMRLSEHLPELVR